MQKNTFTPGFTLVELLVVLGLVAAVAGFILVGFQNYAQYQRYDYAVGTVELSLSESRDNAKRGVDGTSHGVKLASTTLTLFNGSTYSSGDPENTTISFSDVYLTYSLSGGTDEIIFDTLTGLPSATGTVVVHGITHSGSTTVSVRGTGDIE